MEEKYINVFLRSTSYVKRPNLKRSISGLVHFETKRIFALKSKLVLHISHTPTTIRNNVNKILNRNIPWDCFMERVGWENAIYMRSLWAPSPALSSPDAHVCLWQEEEEAGARLVSHCLPDLNKQMRVRRKCNGL